MGDEWYGALPEMYRIADARNTTTAGGYPLREYMRSAAVGLDDTMAIADRIGGREFTDPAAADLSWLPWLAQAVGVVPSADEADTRAVIGSKQTAAQPGTPAAVVALARTWLSGDQVCDLVPSSTAWTLVLRVKASEIQDPSPEDLAARLMATGLLPAGFTVEVQTGAPTWDAIDGAAGGQWQPIDDLGQWQTIDSIGVTGV